MLRSDAALEWLVSVLEHSEPRLAEEVIASLAIYRRNAKLEQRLKHALDQRGDTGLQASFEKLWRV